jgi:hypothetical protein
MSAPEIPSPVTPSSVPPSTGDATPAPTWAGAAAPGSPWLARLLPGLVAAAGIYAAIISMIDILRAHNTDAWLLPLATGIVCAVLGLCAAFERSVPITPLTELGSGALAMALLLVYAFVLLPILGFLPASVLLVLAVTASATRRRFVCAGGMVIAVGMWALFAYVLAEPLPGGLW